MRTLLSRLMLTVVAFILAATAFAIAFVFLCDALFLLLEFYLSPPLAALATAGVFVLLGLLALLLTRVEPRTRKSPGARIFEAIEELLGIDVSRHVNRNPETTAGLALLFGLLVGASPRLRGALTDLLKILR